MNEQTPKPPGFKQVRKYLKTIQQREALGGFIRTGWSPSELAEFARDVYLVPGKTIPPHRLINTQWRKALTIRMRWRMASLRAPGFTMRPFSRPVPKEYAWNDPDNPEHSPELRADIEEMWRLWRNRDASKHEQPWPTEEQPIPRWLWKRLFRLRNRYHSLEDTLQFEGLRGYSEPYSEGTREHEHDCCASPNLCAAPEIPSVGTEGPKGPQEACEVTRHLQITPAKTAARFGFILWLNTGRRWNTNGP